MPCNVVIIGGPTASGKSGLAAAVAEACDGVVINADSMQVYRGLPLLTAQPDPADRTRLPHRLYETLDGSSPCSAPRWRGMALAEIDAAHAGGKLPVIVGGTGFYLKTLLSGISPIPDIPAGLRENIAARQREIGNPAFHAELKKRDPVMAEKLDPFNTQRLIRATEVLEGTGRSLAHWQEMPPEGPPPHLSFFTAVLLPAREKLYASCDLRFDALLQAGALQEAAAFRSGLAQGTIPAACPLTHALGYPELSRHLEGAITLEEAVARAKASTRRYAKRQVTWFRHQVTPDLLMDAPDAQRLMARAGLI